VSKNDKKSLKKLNSSIPTGYVRLGDDNSSLSNNQRSSRLSFRGNNMKSPARYLDINKKLIVTLHAVKIQISSNIDLQMCCTCNDSELHSSTVQRVDPKTRTANFKN